MTNTQIITNLWQELREAINQTYKAAKPGSEAEVLRDYTENISWSDDLAALLGRETANERQHRRNRPMVPGFGVSTAAKLILMNNVVKGSEMEEMPKATAFLQLRQTAVEAEVIGWLCRQHLHPDWIRAIKTFDYAKLMQAA